MLTKTVINGIISIIEDRRLQVREDTVIAEDGKEVSRAYFRYVLNPGDDVSTKDQVIQDLAALLWTPEVVQAWKDKEAAIGDGV